MQIKQAGFRIVYDLETRAVEETTPSVEAEFVRKARIAAGDFQSLAFTWRLLNPLRGPVAFAFWSHKLLRWLMPFFLLTAFAANLLLLRHPFYRITLGVQVALYGAGIAGRFVSGRPGPFRLLALLYYFLSMNAALLVGFVRCVTGRQRVTWQRAER
jgi:hypothetical protein